MSGPRISHRSTDPPRPAPRRPSAVPARMERRRPRVRAVGGVVSSTDITAAGNRFARMLDTIGVSRRGAVAVLTGNVPEYLAAYRGATWSGRQFTPMSWRWSPDEVAYVVGNCEADVLVVEARYAHLAEAAAELVAPDRRFAVGGAVAGFRDWTDVEALSGDGLQAPVVGSTMLYTSGTTGRPKGVRREPPEGPPPGRMGAGRDDDAAGLPRRGRRPGPPRVHAAVPLGPTHLRRRRRPARRRPGPARPLRSRGRAPDDRGAPDHLDVHGARRSSSDCSASPRRPGGATTCRR